MTHDNLLYSTISPQIVYLPTTWPGPPGGQYLYRNGPEEALVPILASTAKAVQSNADHVVNISPPLVAPCTLGELELGIDLLDVQVTGALC